MGMTEAAKTVSTLDSILAQFLKCGGSRKTVMMPVGGGIVSNTFGLAAGLLFRGIRLVQVPTSFLNAHDAASSSQKQAVNHAGYKNIVGLYHCPTMVGGCAEGWKRAACHARISRGRPVPAHPARGPPCVPHPRALTLPASADPPAFRLPLPGCRCCACPPATLPSAPAAARLPACLLSGSGAGRHLLLHVAR